MTREISPICDFIFGSICTGLLTDVVDMELMVRMVKGIYTYRKGHTAESMVFSPWSKTIIPVPSLRRKIQAYQDENNKQTSAWNQEHAAPHFPIQPQPKHKHTSGKTRTRWSNQRNWFNPIKKEHYNTQNKETTDIRKIDLIRPTPKWLCTRIHEWYTYCTYGALHPPNTPLDWSSGDWDGTKAKAREQCPLLGFNFLEKQIKKTLQDPIQDVSLDLPDSDNKIEKDLTKDMQALTLKGAQTQRQWWMSRQQTQRNQTTISKRQKKVIPRCLLTKSQSKNCNCRRKRQSTTHT